MSPPPSKSGFSLLCFFSLIFLAQSSPNLLPSDFNALLQVQKELGLRRALARNPCDVAGIFCERGTVNSSDFLRVTRIVFISQNLTGRLSAAIAKLSELKELSLPNNHLFDEIPQRIINCQKLEILNLNNNRFSGEIPTGLSSLIRLRILDFSANRFTGNLKFLRYFPNLEKLNLADNLFTGKVPVSLKSFRNLRSVNISGNTLLEGPIPWMNNNYLEDTNPKRYIFAEAPSSGKNRSSSHSAMVPFPSQGAPAPGPSATPPRHRHRNRKRKIIIWVAGFVAGSIAGVISGIVFSMLFKLLMFLIRGRSKDTSLRIFSPMIKKPEDLAFLDDEERLAALEVIGKGGCGEVYKAVLPGSDGKEIAIKKITQPSADEEDINEENSKLLTKKMQQIRSEIKTVGEIRHRNLLPLLAHLPRSNCHYLVYEYMKNGSLHDYLQDVTAGRRELDWPARYKIALGVAAGLEYLHISHTPMIIHRDLKPANILLDDEMEARIADFGLAKSMPESDTHVTTSKIAGTVGYIAPEYYKTFKFTDKCDIYSFGVVLGVLVMGKLPSDEFFQNTEEMNLVKWMRNTMTSNDPKRALNEKLLGQGFEDQMLLVLKVACFCTVDEPKERPNSKDARCMLSQIKK